MCSVVLLFVFVLHISSGYGYDFSFAVPDVIEVGSCANPKTVSPFNPDQFAGTWFHVMEVPNTFVAVRHCTSMNTTVTGQVVSIVTRGLDVNYLPVNQSATIRSVTPLDPTRPDPFLQVISKGVPAVPYHILEMDYKSYGCIYSCFEFVGLKVEIFYVLSRRPTISNKNRNKCFDSFKKIGLDTNKLHEVNHGEVCGHPSPENMRNWEEEEEVEEVHEDSGASGSLDNGVKGHGLRGERPENLEEKTEDHPGLRGERQKNLGDSDPLVSREYGGDVDSDTDELYHDSYGLIDLGDYESYEDDPHYDVVEEKNTNSREGREEILAAKAMGGETRPLDRSMRHGSPLKRFNRRNKRPNGKNQSQQKPKIGNDEAQVSVTETLETISEEASFTSSGKTSLQFGDYTTRSTTETTTVSFADLIPSAAPSVSSVPGAVTTPNTLEPFSTPRLIDLIIPSTRTTLNVDPSPSLSSVITTPNTLEPSSTTPRLIDLIISSTRTTYNVDPSPSLPSLITTPNTLEPSSNTPRLIDLIIPSTRTTLNVDPSHSSASNVTNPNKFDTSSITSSEVHPSSIISSEVLVSSSLPLTSLTTSSVPTIPTTDTSRSSVTQENRSGDFDTGETSLSSHLLPSRSCLIFCLLTTSWLWLSHCI
ncbi:uncharacterized protein LOC143041366 [Oratosquilla oratoria]|uniref:uncharacterized protein LOC143041366 n=1 Tax=Oratosquilla oratoria TaxID=337810 RepID=UPI003F76E916